MNEEFNALISKMEALLSASSHTVHKVDNLQSDISRQFTEFSKQMQTTNMAVSQLSERVSACESEIAGNNRHTRIDQEKQSRRIDKIEEILDELLRSDAVLRREKHHAVLQKEKVYDRFAREGIGKSDILRTLERSKKLIRGKDCRTVLHWDEQQCKPLRVIKIWVEG